MNWVPEWHVGLMWASVLLLVGALYSVLRFVRNASSPNDDEPAPREGDKNGGRF